MQGKEGHQNMSLVNERVSFLIRVEISFFGCLVYTHEEYLETRSFFDVIRGISVKQ